MILIEGLKGGQTIIVLRMVIRMVIV